LRPNFVYAGSGEQTCDVLPTFRSPIKSPRDLMTLHADDLEWLVKVIPGDIDRDVFVSEFQYIIDIMDEVNDNGQTSCEELFLLSEGLLYNAGRDLLVIAEFLVIPIFTCNNSQYIHSGIFLASSSLPAFYSTGHDESYRF